MREIKIADYDELATRLGMHVRSYAFSTWRLWIRDYYTSSPSFSAEEFRILETGYRIGALEKAINYVKKARSTELKKWCIKPTIRDFFLEKYPNL